jgi:hypothetical protein
MQNAPATGLAIRCDNDQPTPTNDRTRHRIA